MKINDLAGLSEPLTKLIEVVSAGIGNASQPIFDIISAYTKGFERKKMADAKAYEIKIISKAIGESEGALGVIGLKNGEIELSSIEKGKLTLNSKEENKEINISMSEGSELANRALSRILFQETQRQQNIENITQIAAEQIAKEEEVSKEKVDEDWINKFFKIAGDISNEEMQLLWGKILAGEVKNTQSYSIRTLNVLKNMSKREAISFQKMAQAVIINKDLAFIMSDNKILNQEFGISFTDCLSLEDIGLLNAGANIILDLKAVNSNLVDRKYYKFGDHSLMVDRKNNTPRQKIEIFIVSKVGKELLSLLSIKTNYNYMKQFAIKMKTPNVTLSYSKILSESNGVYKLSVPLTPIE